MPNWNIVETADRFREALLRQERKGALRMIDVYGQISSRLVKKSSDLAQAIEEARSKGEAISPSWLSRQDRYKDLLRQATAEMKRFASLAEKMIMKSQQQAANAALRDAVDLMAAAASDASISANFNRLPTAAVENLVGFLGDGSPLKDLLDELPKDGKKIIEDGLIDAISMGIGPAATARKIRDGLDGNKMRALMISRTETLRAYRTATHQTYRANADVVRGWTWRSSRSRRSCAACIALDGVFQQVSEPMRAHVRCRCVMIPTIKRNKVDRGPDWFDDQPEDVQRDILGTDKGFEAYKEGKLRLQDFVGLERDKRWGDSFHQLSVKRALAGEGDFPGARPRPAPPPAPPPAPQAPPKARKPSKATSAQGEGARMRAKLNAIADREKARRQAINDERNELFKEVPNAKTRAEERKIFTKINNLNKAEKKSIDRETADQQRAVFQSKAAVFKTDIRVNNPYLRDDIIPPGILTFRRLIGFNTALDASQTIKIRELPKGRAFYTNGYIYATIHERRHVITHELGHWLENKDPRIRQAVFDFYTERTKGDKLESLRKLTGNKEYKPNEKTKKDKWASPYIGRYYSDRYGRLVATEVLSMGLEQLSFDPHRFATNDPEYFDFMIEVLRMK